MAAVPGLGVDRYFAECGNTTASPGLGDYAEMVFASIGITPESYCAAKARFGLPPTCNCEESKAWLNRVSDWWRGNRD